MTVCDSLSWRDGQLRNNEASLIPGSQSATVGLYQRKTNGVFGSVWHTNTGRYRTGWTSCVRLSSEGNAREGTGCWQRLKIPKRTPGGAQYED